MRFDQPQFLAFVPVAFVALGVFYAWAFRRRRRLLERFATAELAAKLTRGVSRGRQRVKALLMMLAICLILLAMARPQYGVIERPLQRRGVEVLIAVDCSLSMLARDMEPNRLARALEQLRGLIYRLEGDNVGVIAFAGTPIVQCPLTGDYAMALNLLETMGVDSVPVQGTAIGKAIDKAAETFRIPGKGQKVLVLLTDGEDHEGDPVEAARKAAEAGVTIYAIGIGSVEGQPIPLPEGGYKESHGTKVNTRLDFDTLRQIASITGGRAIKANPSGDLELREVYRGIDAMKEADFSEADRTIREERYQPILVLAALALTARLFIGDRQRRTTREGVGRFD